MRVLLDHCVPKRFGFLLEGHFVRTASFMKWSDLKNGELLIAGASEFDALVTVDRGIPSQQHTGELPMALIAMVSLSNKIEHLAPMAPEVMKVLGSGLQKRVYVIRIPGP